MDFWSDLNWNGLENFLAAFERTIHEVETLRAQTKRESIMETAQGSRTETGIEFILDDAADETKAAIEFDFPCHVPR